MLQARALPVISETTLKTSLVGKPLAIRAAPTGDMTAKVLSEELLKRGYRSIGLLLVDIPYYRDIVDALKVYLERGGAKLEVIGAVGPDTTDFKSLIAKTRSQRHDAIGIFLLNEQVISYYRQAWALQFRAPTFGASIHDSQELIDRAGPGAEGALLVGYDVTSNFRARWLAAFGTDARTGCGANA